MPQPCQEICDEPELVGLVLFTSLCVEMLTSEKDIFMMSDDTSSEVPRFEL